MKKSQDRIVVAVIGLGYVGLPLAIELSKKFPTTGFDINTDRIEDLQKGIDKTLEVHQEDLLKSTCTFTSEPSVLADINCFIITVPTPVDDYKIPDLTMLKNASQMIGNFIKKGDFVVYESTVYPGATEEICIPILEEMSSLKVNEDFGVGYSPERINPGDKEHTLTKITKVVSGSNQEYLNKIDHLYSSIITAGTHPVSSLRVAEAAKVIENIQRDINIAFVNELSMLLREMEIDCSEVLEAARTKWNFLDFRPGLVGGHCIGVDPYYLVHKSNELNFHTELITAGRRINDRMPSQVVNLILTAIMRAERSKVYRRILIFGATFKENCPDIRNSKVFEIHQNLTRLNFDVSIYDQNVNFDEVKKEYDIEILQELPSSKFDVILLAVPHRNIMDLGINTIKSFGCTDSLFFDLKSAFPIEQSDLRL